MQYSVLVRLQGKFEIGLIKCSFCSLPDKTARFLCTWKPRNGRKVWQTIHQFLWQTSMNLQRNRSQEGKTQWLIDRPVVSSLQQQRRTLTSVPLRINHWTAPTFQVGQPRQQEKHLVCTELALTTAAAAARHRGLNLRWRHPKIHPISPRKAH